MPAVNYKILGQAAPAGTTWVDLYVVPAPKEAIVSSMTVSNTGLSLAFFRIAVCPAAIATPSPQHYVYYDVALAAQDTFIATVGITLAAANRIKVYASTASITFQVFGSELTP